MYEEQQNLKEHAHHQNQSYEVLRVQNLHLEGEVQHLRDLANDAQVIVQEQYDKAEAWKTEHFNLTEFANNLVRDILRMHRRASNVVLPCNVPHEVLEFIEICDIVLKEFKAHLGVAMKA